VVVVGSRAVHRYDGGRKGEVRVKGEKWKQWFYGKRE